jgi:hypothetical protein
MLTGRYYDNSLPFEAWKKAAFLPGSLPAVLRSKRWEVDLFPKISYSLYYAPEVASNVIPGMPRLERMIDLAYVFDLGLFRSLPHFLKRPVYNDQDWFVKRLYMALANRRSAIRGRDAAPRLVGRTIRNKPWRKRLFSQLAFTKSQDVRFVDAMMHDSRLDLDAGAFKFYHLGGPHIPLALDENLDYAPMAVDRENYLKTATASLKLMGLFLKKLETLGAYDDTLIFIVGDHGAGFQGQELHAIPGAPGVGGGEIVTQPARVNSMPLILAKPFRASGPLRTSDAPVSLSDIPATVFQAVGLDVEAPGRSMFAVPEGEARERRFLVYSGRDIYSYYGDMDEYLVSGPGWLESSWRRSGRVFTKRGLVVQERETYRLGIPLDMGPKGNGGPYLEYGWDASEEGRAWTVGRRALLVVPISPSGKDLVLKATLSAHENVLASKEQDILISVNGVPVGRWRMEAGAERTYEATIPAGTAGDTLRILFEIPGAMAAPEKDESGDILKRGIALTRLLIE